MLAFDAATVAHACNGDLRFQEAGWQESVAGIGELLVSNNFQLSLAHMAPHAVEPTLATVVAAVYAYRRANRRTPNRSGLPKTR